MDFERENVFLDQGLPSTKNGNKQQKKHACVIFFFQDVDRVLICSCPFYSMKKEEGEKTQDPKIVEPTRSRLAALFA